MSGNTGKESSYLRLLDWLTQVANVCGSFLILGLTALIGADVLSRNLFDAPISGVPEMVTLSIVAIVFLQAPQALKAGRMTRADALINFLYARAPRVAKVFDTIFDLLGAFIVAAILYSTYPIFIKSWVRSDFIGAIGDFTAPTWPVKLMLLFGGTLLACQFLARIVRRCQIDSVEVKSEQDA